MSEKKEKVPLLPLSLSVFAIILDQITKYLVEKNIEINTVAWSALNNFFMLVHQKNTGAAFSFGNELSGVIRLLVLIILPLLLMALLIYYYLKQTDITKLQRWALSAIIGGGIGNLIDRIFRPEGVVDFLSFKFFGIFGWDRFPTFNVADSCITVGCILIIISSFFNAKNNQEAKE